MHSRENQWDPHDGADDKESLTKCLLNVEDSFQKCSHSVGSVPLVHDSVYNQKFCAVLDTGAEISLVTLSALRHVNYSSVTVLSDRHVCDLVGFSGEVTSVTGTVKYVFKWDRIPCVNFSNLQLFQI